MPGPLERGLGTRDGEVDVGHDLTHAQGFTPSQHSHALKIAEVGKFKLF